VNNVQRLFFGLAMLCVFGPLFMPDRIDRSVQRRIFWSSVCLAAIFGFFASYPKLTTGLWVAGTLFAVMTFIAYANTPYIKIRGKIYAVSISLQQPDPGQAPRSGNARPRGIEPAESDSRHDPHRDSYGGTLTATTFWWMVVGVAVIAAGNGYFLVSGRAGAAPTAVSAGLLFLTAIAAGHGDASWGYRVARGQYLQFGIASVLTAGSFTAVYIIAFYVGRRWPLRRTQSMEYRAHPRHQNKQQTKRRTRDPEL
jgi:hypothetical protein